jgi:DNA-binding NarL/FixJ family response regulator
MSEPARLLLVGGTPALRTALAAQCAGDMAEVADAAAVLRYLGGEIAALPRVIVVDGATLDAVATTAALKRDGRAAMIPLTVIADAAVVEACYRAGANACVLRPANRAPAMRELAAALTGYWLGANEVPPANA